MFSCEFCAVTKITFFTEHFRTNASVKTEQYLVRHLLIIQKQAFCKAIIQLFSTGIFLGYGQELHLVTLQNNYFSCTDVNGGFQSIN